MDAGPGHSMPRPRTRILDGMATLADAHSALSAGSWELAMSLFGDVGRTTGDARAFEGQAQAAWWLDDADRSIGARSAAYRRFRDLGDDLGAGRAATALAWDSQLFGQGDAVAMGWLRRAHDLLDPLEESVEHGWLAVREAELALSVQHDPGRACAAAERAAMLGRRTHAPDLVIVALALEGLARTSQGDLEAGMPLLDAAVAAATSGEVSDLMWLGKVCCWLIAACQESLDLGRARDWCLRVEALCRERDLAPLFNVCRITHAGIQIARGTWDDAERELDEAMERMDHSHRTSRLGAVVSLGELRRRQGRVEEAEALFRQAEFAPGAVIGRALIRRDDGDAAGACRALEELLASVPEDNRLARASVLAPLVEVAVAAQRQDLARTTAAELRATAVAVGTDALLASAARADAVLSEPPQAAALAREAVRLFQAADLGYDEAGARLVLAQALEQLDDDAAAREQVDRACDSFGELGAAVMLAKASAMRAALAADHQRVLTTRESQVLGLVAEGLSTAAIAQALTLSPHTVHRHVANILTKLDQTSRAGAVAAAMQAGLL